MEYHVPYVILGCFPFLLISLKLILYQSHSKEISIRSPLFYRYPANLKKKNFRSLQFVLAHTALHNQETTKLNKAFAECTNKKRLKNISTMI